MHKIDNSKAVLSKPSPGAVGPNAGYFDTVSGVGTTLDPSWCNSVQDELVNTIEAAGLTLDKADDTQLSRAINRFRPKTLGLTSGTLGLRQTTNGTYTYNLSDFTDAYELPFDNITGTFLVGDTVTGGTSGATAVVRVVNASDLVVQEIGGTPPFQDNEQITGTGGATADVDNLTPADTATGLNYAVYQIDPDSITEIHALCEAGSATSTSYIYSTYPDDTEVTLLYSGIGGPSENANNGIIARIPIDNGQSSFDMRALGQGASPLGAFRLLQCTQLSI